MYQLNSLNIADGGEMTTTSDVRDFPVSIVMNEGNIQGGGRMHMANMIINAGNFTVDDLGVVQGDGYDTG